MSQFSTNMRNGWRSRHQSEIHISFAQATDRELGADWQQLHADQELGRRVRADRHGDAGRAGLVPRPAGDDADAQVGLGHGLDQGQIIDEVSLRFEPYVKGCCAMLGINVSRKYLNFRSSNGC